MAPRRVVADSDDEDDDDTFSPVRYPSERPEPEPLSPLHQPSSPDPVDKTVDLNSSGIHISDKTDTSFFASIYNEQQNGVLQQSHLVENIVRESQKASASSGDVSLPGKGKGKNKVRSSSPGTDITSPVVLHPPADRQSMFSDDATQLATPRKSAGGDMWDVPSSVESSGGRKKALTTYGKRKRGNSMLNTGSTGAAMFGGGGEGLQDQTEQVAEDAAAGDDGFVKPSPLPARKKSKVSLYDATSQNPTTFYIAQSNLTTMEKVQYQKVAVPANPYAGITTPSANPKSSSVSTIAYSTPSFYASSGPPLPWERTVAEPEPEPELESEQLETSQHVIDITSSPDVMASGHDRPKRRKSISTSHAEVTPDATIETLPAPSKTPASQKRKRKSERIEDVDELGQDESWDSDTAGYHREVYKPRPTRRRSNATSIHEDETAQAQQEEVEESVNVVDMAPAEEAVADPVDEQNSTSNALPTAPEAPETTKQESAPTVQPKKRGRKKKQPVVEEVLQDEPPAEEVAAPAEPDPPFQAPEVEEAVGKPKRKRGRPRKSDQAKAAEIAAPSPPAEPPKKPAGKVLDSDNDEVSPEDDEEKPKPKKTAQKPKKKDSNVAEDTTREDASSALKEVDANSSVPSRSASSEPASKKATAMGSPATENKQAKSPAKETPKSAASQSKVLYRVGLSKKTRIAPLLKSIRK